MSAPPLNGEFKFNAFVFKIKNKSSDFDGVDGEGVKTKLFNYPQPRESFSTPNKISNERL